MYCGSLVFLDAVPILYMKITLDNSSRKFTQQNPKLEVRQHRCRKKKAKVRVRGKKEKLMVSNTLETDKTQD